MTGLSRVNRQSGKGQDQYNFDRNYWICFLLYEVRGIGLEVCNAVVGTGIFRMKVLSTLRLVYSLLSTSDFLKRLGTNRHESRKSIHKSLVGRQGIDRQIQNNSARVKRQRSIDLNSRKEIRITRRNMPALYAPRLQRRG